jgi:hypothetical protein
VILFLGPRLVQTNRCPSTVAVRLAYPFPFVKRGVCSVACSLSSVLFGQISVGGRGFGPTSNADAQETLFLVDTLSTVGGERLSQRRSKLSAGGVICPVPEVVGWSSGDTWCWLEWQLFRTEAENIRKLVFSLRVVFYCVYSVFYF